MSFLVATVVAVSDQGDAPTSGDDATRKALESLNESIRRSAQASEALRLSGAPDAIKEWTRRSKFLEDIVRPNKALTESMEKLKGLEIDLQGPGHLIEETQALEKMLGPSIETRPIPAPPPSPVHETNRRLGDLNSEVEGLRSIQAEMISVLQTMITVQKRTDWKTLGILLLTALLVILAIVLR